MRDREAVLAEVFIRVARSRRLDWSATGGPSEHRREESGVALRVWDGSGREGFVHADDVAAFIERSRELPVGSAPIGEYRMVRRVGRTIKL